LTATVPFVGLLVSAALAMTGCASTGDRRADPSQSVEVPPTEPKPVLAITAFSSARTGEALPGQWQPFLLTPNKKKTHWRLERPGPWDATLDAAPGMARKWLTTVDRTLALPQAGRPPAHGELRRVSDTTGPNQVPPPALALRGDAEQAASGIAHPVGRTIAPNERLQWDWRIDLPPSDADPGDRSREDSAMRVALSFNGDRSQMPARELMLSDLSQALTGHEIPYATLVYVWAPERELGEIVIDPRTTRVRSIVVGNQTTPMRTWLRTRRDVAADFAEVFGEPPGSLKGIALFVDADHTESRAIGWYGDLSLR
jgi:hypothetical protein